MKKEGEENVIQLLAIHRTALLGRDGRNEREGRWNGCSANTGPFQKLQPQDSTNDPSLACSLGCQHVPAFRHTGKNSHLSTKIVPFPI